MLRLHISLPLSRLCWHVMGANVLKVDPCLLDLHKPVKYSKEGEQGKSWLLFARWLLRLTSNEVCQFRWIIHKETGITRAQWIRLETCSPPVSVLQEKMLFQITWPNVHIPSPPHPPLPLAAGSGSCRTFLELHSALTSWRPSHCPTSKYITWTLLPSSP